MIKELNSGIVQVKKGLSILAVTDSKIVEVRVLTNLRKNHVGEYQFTGWYNGRIVIVVLCFHWTILDQPRPKKQNFWPLKNLDHVLRNFQVQSIQEGHYTLQD